MLPRRGFQMRCQILQKFHFFLFACSERFTKTDSLRIWKYIFLLTNFDKTELARICIILTKSTCRMHQK